MMEMRFEQNLEQTLRLLLSPQVLQGLKILSLSYTDMVSEIERASEENPVLEIESHDALSEYIRCIGSDKKVKKKLDVKEYPGIENLKEVLHDLRTHLLEQVKLEDLDGEALDVAERLIDGLDNRGYLTEYEEIKKETIKELGVSSSAVDKVLKVVQGLEPEGVGARDLKECLLIQIHEHNFENAELEGVLKKAVLEHLEDLGQGNFKKVAEALDISESGVQEIQNFIKNNLDPSPASAFGEESRHVIPSFTIEHSKGKFKIINLEERYGPKLTLSSQYERMLKDPKTDAETVKFLKEKLEKAKEMLEALEKRKKTSEELIQNIVSTQKEFLEKGAAFAKPLLQKDLAQKLGVHPSTISRAVSQKYVQTPQGLFSLKHFCQRGIKGLTPVRIKAMLLSIVSDEDKKNPLSDEELKEALAKEGALIERRTVAAYRKELGILSAPARANL